MNTINSGLKFWLKNLAAVRQCNIRKWHKQILYRVAEEVVKIQSLPGKWPIRNCLTIF